MMEKHEINIILGARKILSVNALYSARLVYMKGRPCATIYKSGEAKKTEDYIKEQVRLLNVPVNYPWVNKDTLFKMNINIIFKSGYLLRDLDNCFKLIQDGIFRAMELNDSHVVEIHAKKQLFPGIKEEKILVNLVEVDKSDIRFDSIPSPHVVWCKEKLDFKPLPKRGRKDGVIYQTENKDLADTKIYILDPTRKSELTLNTFSDINLDIIENVLESKGFAYILIIGNEESWGTEIWKDIKTFENTIAEMTKSYSGVKAVEIESREKLKELLK